MFIVTVKKAERNHWKIWYLLDWIELEANPVASIKIDGEIKKSWLWWRIYPIGCHQFFAIHEEHLQNLLQDMGTVESKDLQKKSKMPAYDANDALANSGTTLKLTKTSTVVIHKKEQQLDL